MKLISEFDKKKRVKDFKTKVVCTDGSVRPVQLNISSIEKEKERYIISSLFDLTQAEKELLLKEKQRLERLEGIKDDLIHTINNKMTGIIGYIDLLDVKIPYDVRDEDLKRILNALNNSVSEVQESLKVYWDIKTTIVRGERTNIYTTSLEIIEEVKEQQKNSTSSINILINYKTPENQKIYCTVPEEILKRVLRNLIYNGLSYVGDDNYILLNIDTQTPEKYDIKDEIYLDVINNGEPIPREIQGLIFRPGYSSRNSTGMGLNICRELLRTYDSDISLEGSNEECTVFRLYLKKARD